MTACFSALCSARLTSEKILYVFAATESLAVEIGEKFALHSVDRRRVRRLISWWRCQMSFVHDSDRSRRAGTKRSPEKDFFNTIGPKRTYTYPVKSACY